MVNRIIFYSIGPWGYDQRGVIFDGCSANKIEKIKFERVKELDRWYKRLKAAQLYKKILAS
jgi:hypothetical protein